MRRKLPKILLLLLIPFIGMQAIRPSMSNPASDPKLSLDAAASTPPGDRVMGIFQRSCYDCHSNQVRWPWYSQIAPISWTVAHDVEEGRENLNFSTWGSYSTEDKVDILKDLCDEVEAGKMPPGNYLVTHGDAELSKAEIDILCQWAKQETARVGGSSGDDRSGRRGGEERGRVDDRGKSGR